MICDITIIGGGIVGLGTALAVRRQFPDFTILLLEKEPEVACHQTGHNSGVIHSGIYYKPGSHKARLCRIGREKLIDFCRQHGVPFELCGKIIVATSEAEIPHLKTLQERAVQNGLQGVRRITSEIQSYEPACVGIAGLVVPEAGIVNYKAVCLKYLELLHSQKVSTNFSTRVLDIVTIQGVKHLTTSKGAFRTRHLINCAGLYSDKVAQLDGLSPDVRIVPFRGEYFKLNTEAAGLVKNLIYPVPDPAFPFLGVHFTRMIDGKVECGPNAVFAFRREGYEKLSVHPVELLESLAWPGVLRLFKKHWRMGLEEYKRSFSKQRFIESLQRMVPSIRSEQISPVTAGVRAQAVTRDGKNADDFIFAEGRGSLHVLNAPSPAATASLAIGEEICARFQKAFFH